MSAANSRAAESLNEKAVADAMLTVPARNSSNMPSWITSV